MEGRAQPRLFGWSLLWQRQDWSLAGGAEVAWGRSRGACHLERALFKMLQLFRGPELAPV